MKNTSLRNLIEKASEDISTYKRPDIDDCVEALEKILVAGGIGSIIRDTIDNIEIYKDNVYIETSYTVRGCGQNSSYTIPVYVIDAEDPIKEIKIWRVNKKIVEQTNTLIRDRNSVLRCEENLRQLAEELAQLTGTNNDKN